MRDTHPQVQALRAIEPHLGLDALYVLGTNCVDNGPRAGLEKFLAAASDTPETALHYEVRVYGAPVRAVCCAAAPPRLARAATKPTNRRRQPPP